MSIAGGAALLALTAAGLLPASWWRSWDIASWTATLLFMLEPLSALVRLRGSARLQAGLQGAPSACSTRLPAQLSGVAAWRACRC